MNLKKRLSKFYVYLVIEISIKKMIKEHGIDVNQALKSFFGFNGFKGRQQEIVESIIGGNDTFVIMPTGGGKSLCYQLPAISLPGTAVVVSPLIALMKNQVDAIRNVSSDDSIAHFLNSSLTKTESNNVKDDIRAGKTKLLYVAPESLNKAETIQFLKSVQISFFAIDEAHCISEWGHDFRPEYRKLKPMIDSIRDNIAIIALTATATPKVQNDIQRNLGMNNANVFLSSFNRDNLYYEVRPKEEEDKQIVKYIKENTGKSGIIYCLSRKKVEQLAEVLQINGIKALPYHAGLEAGKRGKHQDMFLMEDVDVIVATIAFGMGIDKPDVRFVIHYDIPKSIEGYYQETGRAGRDGGEGKCITFYSYKDIEKLEKFLQGKPVAEQEIGRQLLMEVVSFAEASICRRKFILHYFGEEYNHELCDEKCDNCKNPKEQYEGQDYVHILLKSILELKEMHKSKYVSNFISGFLTNEIKNYNHNNSKSFGIGSKQDDKFWNSVIRQALVMGFVEKEIESYGTLKVTEKGYEFLKTPFSVELCKERDFVEEAKNVQVNQKSTGGVDEVLLAMLKDLRKKIADQKNVPPFVVFQEPSLEEMCIQYPITVAEMQNIIGVGQGKASRYGKSFIELISRYVDENEIDRPNDMVVKSVANKSGLKIHIITGIDRKSPIEDIASNKGTTYNEVIAEIEGIVASGTRVNLDYYINDMLDDDSQGEIFEYFMTAETDSIDEAINEFDGDYEEDELRLMRIKFMSEMAN